MVHAEKLDKAIGLYSGIDTRVSGVALSYLATLEKISEVSMTEWQDSSLSRFEQKMQMKDVGGCTFQFTEFLHENSVISLAKVVEDTSIELKRLTKFKFDSVKNHHDVNYLKELQMLRALANVIKHNVSYLDRKTSESARFLVDECGLTDGYPLNAFILSGHSSFNIIEYIPKVYIAMCHLVEIAVGIKHPILNLSYDEAFEHTYESLIPSVIQVKRPNKLLKSDS